MPAKIAHIIAGACNCEQNSRKNLVNAEMIDYPPLNMLSLEQIISLLDPLVIAT